MEYTKGEHPLEYECVVREGRLPQIAAPPPSGTALAVGTILGFASLALGLTLIVFVLWAVLF